MHSISYRHLQPADQAAMLALWNRHAVFDPMTPALLHEKVWNDADVRPGLTWAAEQQGQLIGFSIGVVRHRETGPVGYIKLLAVDTAHRGQGVGSRLLQATECALQRAGTHEVRIGESAPNYLTPGLDQRYTAGKCFFEARGYECIGTAANLTVDLTQNDFTTAEPEARLATHGITVRRAQVSDSQPILAVVKAHWPIWHAEVTNALRNVPISLHLALQQGNILGFSAYDTNNFGTGWFGPMGTIPAAEEQGLGRVLLWRCLRDQKHQGHATAMIPWVGPIDFYTRYAGAQIDRIFDRYVKRLDKYRQV
ncbi:GNAT family N-acetyltransferase [Candidatus Entotheonella palauensis]|uniref:GNAT family N-acetyltransferase n=1 Tax=Candidatus Entotheonella palauensis TaxID=93172 RepID=UPI000B7DCDAC|nr:GNAT family N-acetyltransferase [Candidatus Entotheonella palauensis]